MITINTIKLITIFDYARLIETEKMMLIKKSALFLENYYDSGVTVYVYFLNDFFIEITEKNGKIVDNIPYKRGYRVNEHSKKKTSYSKAA